MASSGDGNGYLITKDPLIPNNLTFNNRLGQGDYERAKISPIDPNIGVYHVNGGFFKPSITWTLTLAPGGYSAHELFIPKPNPAAGFTINDDEAGWSYRHLILIKW
ncbi:MAG: hypothetical protein IPL12_16930 [Bacteroidetes bacterium]|nr:hypothetical protein [Bacteroidota bacterium]